MNSIFKKILPLLVVLFFYSFINAAAMVNYDTAWTIVYDGGVNSNGNSINDYFCDIKILNDGRSVCVGKSGDSSATSQTFLMKIDANGKTISKKLINTLHTKVRFNRQEARSLAIAKNGDYIIAGVRYTGPYLMRTDSLGNVKYSYWHYDSLNEKSLLSMSCVINSIRETQRGTIICAAGDVFPDNDGSNLNNYAAYLEFDSTLNLIRYREWDNKPGYEIAGFNIEETRGGEYLLSGNRAVFYLDTSGAPKWQKSYTYQLEGTGTQVANIFRAKVLRDNTPVIAGQVYESDCWVNYKRYYYDAWWTPVRYSDGSIVSWDTAGIESGNDIIYDFTQLKSGNLVFVGNPQYVGGIQMLWVFVTDSTGKKLLWEKKYEGPDSLHIQPYSVAATPDSGFTVVGWGAVVNNTNAFAMHFIPMAPVPNKPVPCHLQAKPAVSTTIAGSRMLFTYTGNAANSAFTIYDIAGKKIASLRSSTLSTGNTSFVLDRSRISNGVYSYCLSSNSGLITGMFVLK
ncbi:MAG TPA: T9SS type A sorting domain-containing protein [Chitinispirillaceae bacterium]|nr:T9SS type A sorting domain-containing protein [Chitinispirillaceae bacterium]